MNIRSLFGGALAPLKKDAPLVPQLLQRLKGALASLRGPLSLPEILVVLGVGIVLGVVLRGCV